MREILFRGKLKNSGEWAFGCYYKQTEFYGDELEDHIIITSHEDLSYDQALEHCIVDPETIGQFTGLTDKNGKKIFEGDILRIVSKDYVGFNEIGKVEFQNGCFGASYFPVWERKYSFGKWHFHRIGQIDKWQDMSASGEMKYTYEVVGNIHDNPELLEEDEDD